MRVWPYKRGLATYHNAAIDGKLHGIECEQVMDDGYLLSVKRALVD